MEFAGESLMREGLSTGSVGEARAAWSDAAFEAVFVGYYARIVAVIQRMPGDRARAEELASDAFLKLYQRPGSSEGLFENVGGWLYRTATRLGIDSLRAAARRSRYEAAAARELAGPAGPDPLEEALRAERARAVRGAMARLKPQQAEILTLRASGLSYRELAEALGIHPASVGRLLARAEQAFEKTYRRANRSSGLR